jgi:hypothetical protein
MARSHSEYPNRLQLKRSPNRLFRNSMQLLCDHARRYEDEYLLHTSEPPFTGNFLNTLSIHCARDGCKGGFFKILISFCHAESMLQCIAVTSLKKGDFS